LQIRFYDHADGFLPGRDAAMPTAIGRELCFIAVGRITGIVIQIEFAPTAFCKICPDIEFLLFDAQIVEVIVVTANTTGSLRRRTTALASSLSVTTTPASAAPSAAAP
jgi:hypothetical protein